MKHAKLRFCASWPILLSCNIIAWLLFVVFSIRFYTTENQVVNIVSRSPYIIIFFYLAYCFMLINITYKFYETGKERFMLMRKYYISWVIGDVVFVLIQIALVHGIMWYILYHEFETFVSSSDVAVIPMTFQQLIQMDWFMNIYMNANFINIIWCILCAIAISLWIHNVSITFIRKKRHIYDVLLYLSIMLILVSFYSLMYAFLALVIMYIINIISMLKEWNPQVIEK